MTEKQVLLVKHSWSYVTGQLDDLYPIFNKKLGHLCPELKPLLKRLNKEKRLAIIMTAINHMVAALPDLQKAEKQLLLALAEYSDLDISRSYYESALIAFLMTLEKKLGKNWTEEIRDAWIFIFASMHQHLLRQLQLPAVLSREASVQP
jgi:hemoglobin-like flavoprotein